MESRRASNASRRFNQRTRRKTCDPTVSGPPSPSDEDDVWRLAEARAGCLDGWDWDRGCFSQEGTRWPEVNSLEFMPQILWADVLRISSQS